MGAEPPSPVYPTGSPWQSSRILPLRHSWDSDQPFTIIDGGVPPVVQSMGGHHLGQFASLNEKFLFFFWSLAGELSLIEVEWVA